MKKRILILLPILLFVFLFSSCSHENKTFSDVITFAISIKKDGSISQQISFPTQEDKMALDEETKTEYVNQLCSNLKTTLFFSYFYNFYTTSLTSSNPEFKIGSEKMKYTLPTYDEENQQVFFTFDFANNEVWDFYHPKKENDDGYKIQEGFLVDKGVSSGKCIFTEKISIEDKEQTIGEYFYTILSTSQKRFLKTEIEKPAFVYEYNHYSNKLHTNADFVTEENGLNCHVWNCDFNSLNSKREIEIFVYSPNRAVWYGIALGVTIIFTFSAIIIVKIFKDKNKKKEKI